MKIDETKRLRMENASLYHQIELMRSRLARYAEALRYYADHENWEYTDCGGQFNWNSTIKNDVELNPEIGEGGGTDYAGKRAREALKGLP